METINLTRIVEWIPYNNLQNINYLTKGGFSEIYTAVWTGGSYNKWDSKEKQLKRLGSQSVILKKLENVESANRSWFEEGKSHLSISNKHGQVVECHEEQEAYHSIQFDFDLQDGMITEDESNKRIYFNEGQNNLTVNPNPKKVKLENNDKDEDETYNPNFHSSEKRDELKVTDCK
ncbi:unnamed protein product [Rhizophagus irregularis]|nr:unnamed protein product [Rhizophagus irregularis]